MKLRGGWARRVKGTNGKREYGCELQAGLKQVQPRSGALVVWGSVLRREGGTGWPWKL